MRNKILVADDEKAITDIIKFNLEKEGYTVNTAFDGEECIDKIRAWNPDLVVLDLMMPIKDGFEVLEEVRSDYKLPIIVLTAKGEETDKVQGLEFGADDYMVKPFGMRELLARVKANLRRLEFLNFDDNEIIKRNGMIIDLTKYEVTKNGETLNLTQREFELLKYMAARPGQIFSRENLLKEVWGYDYFGDIRTVDVTIRRLREKIEDKDGEYKYIITKRGLGYYFGG